MDDNALCTPTKTGRRCKCVETHFPKKGICGKQILLLIFSSSHLNVFIFIFSFQCHRFKERLTTCILLRVALVLGFCNDIGPTIPSYVRNPNDPIESFPPIMLQYLRSRLHIPAREQTSAKHGTPYVRTGYVNASPISIRETTNAVRENSIN